MQVNIPAPTVDSPNEWAKYIKALWSDPNNSRRKDTAKEVVEYYEGKQREYLTAELRKFYSDSNSLAFKRKWTHNVTAQIIDALAQVYSMQVKRSLAGKNRKKATTAINNKIWTGLSRVMTAAEKQTQLERTSLLMSKWSERKHRIIYKTFHQYEFDLVWAPNTDERFLQAAILSDYAPLEDANIVVYTHNNTYRFKGTKLVEQINHNTGILPFVVLFSDDPGFQDYLEPDIELTKANLEVNMLQSNLLNIVQTQGHGILVIKIPSESPQPYTDDSNTNSSSADTIEKDHRLDVHDPNKSVLAMHYNDLGQEPKVEPVQFGADFEGIIASIECTLALLGKSYGVEIGDTELKVTAQPQTATSIWITEKKRKAILRENEVLFRDAEKELFAIAHAQARLYDSSIPNVNPEEFTIEYIDTASPLENASIDDLLKLEEKGVITVVQVLMALNPSMSEDDALDMAKKNIEIRIQLQEMAQPLMPAPAANEDEEDENTA